ncbi:translation initiation factor IF-2, partial [bacterium]|nr:translation initiation factor IF-2 [bacterium]
MIEKVRVHEIAKELGIASKDVLDKAKKMGLEVKSAQSVVTMEEAEGLANYIMNGEPAAAPVVEAKSAKKINSDAPKKETPNIEESNTQSVAKEEKSVKVDDLNTTTVLANTTEEEPKKDTLKIIEPNLSKIKKSGLKIVKKKVVVPEVKESFHRIEKQTPNVSSYGKISAEVLEELAQKKKAKQQSGVANARKQEQGIKIDIFGGSMTELSMDMDDQVVLLDLNETQRAPLEAEEVRKPRAPKPAGRNANKKAAPRGRKVSRDKRKKYTKSAQEDEIITHVEIPEDIRVYEFAEKLNKPMSEIIKVLFDLGLMMTKNDFLGADEIEILSEEFGVEVTIVDPKNEFNYEEDLAEEDDSNATERPPVITIMGHVDHGKTSLLDAIRNAKVTQGEAGGITQHIGAYTVEQNGRAITFLDTPGHAAFSSMRQRGTNVTDIIVIVVAADDGVKPQTLEVIKLAKDSGAPVIVALNKMDKETANPDHVKGQMAEQGMNCVEWGGDIEFIPVSAKTGMGIDDLLENILLTADVLELRADKTAMAKAAVVESSLEKGRGPVATVIVQNGTLKVGDYVVCGGSYGRVKALIDDKKQQIKFLEPSHTAVVVGLNEVPSSGEV